MNLIGFILYPFAILYDAITTARNRLYDSGARPSVSFEIPVVGVGNLSVGGTGKTPMIEHLIRLAGSRYRIATLSRGYGRTTKGIRIAGDHDSAATIGDEPMQFYRKFRNKVVVAVGEERALAIPHILQEHPDINLVLLDDAFQHRRVKPSFQILLTAYDRIFARDFLLPAGRLRESKRGAARADVVVVTKCPRNISEEEMIDIESAIRGFTNKAVFFTTISYGALTPVEQRDPQPPQRVILVAGIANPASLETYLRREYQLEKKLIYRDHHTYSTADLETICHTAAQLQAAVVTTEKDIVKMDPEVFKKHGVTLYYLPIETEFLKNGKEFDEMVLNALKSDGQ